jgi:hypothetical protein
MLTASAASRASDKLGREIRRARAHIDGLPAGYRFHDLRHYYASLLVASGADVKIVQHRVRHASDKTTLDPYGHLWPDTDESTPRRHPTGHVRETSGFCGLCADWRRPMTATVQVRGRIRRMDLCQALTQKLVGVKVDR